jgi:hypothetical protein
MESLGHDLAAIAVVLVTAAIFAAMAWASRPH